MTGPIKPPGGPPPAPAPETSEVGSAGPTQRPAASFKASLGHPEGAPAAERTQGGAVSQVDRDLAALVAEARAGKLDRATVEERFLERALGSPMVAALGVEQREALATYLRGQLQSDPAILALLDQLEG